MSQKKQQSEQLLAQQTEKLLGPLYDYSKSNSEILIRIKDEENPEKLKAALIQLDSLLISLKERLTSLKESLKNTWQKLLAPSVESKENLQEKLEVLQKEITEYTITISTAKQQLSLLTSEKDRIGKETTKIKEELTAAESKASSKQAIQKQQEQREQKEKQRQARQLIPRKHIRLDHLSVFRYCD